MGYEPKHSSGVGELTTTDEHNASFDEFTTEGREHNAAGVEIK